MSDSTYTCLLVDDEHELIDSLSFLFDQMKIKCFSANGGYEAVSFLEDKLKQGEGLPQFILSDISMPEGDGLWLLTRLKSSNSVLKDLPLFFMSAFSEWDEAELIKKGAHGLFRKPFSIQDVILLVRKSLK